MKKIISVLLCVTMLLALAACGGDTTPSTPSQGTNPQGTNPSEPAGFNVAGSYKFDPGDQNGLGVEYMLHEDGTYYMDEFTSVVSIGTYTFTEADGTDDEGNKLLGTVTFDFDAEGVSHNVIEKAVDGVTMTYLCDIYCSLSTGIYDLAKLGTDLEETLATIADYYSENYGEDGIHVSMYTDYSYVLDGIYGALEAGSMGTFTKELTEDEKKHNEEQEKSLAELFKSATGKEELTVKLSALKDESMPALLTQDEQGRRFSEMSRIYGQDFKMPEMHTLVLNASNAVVQNLIGSEAGEKRDLMAAQLYDLARMSTRPLEKDEITAFLSRSHKLLEMLAK